MPRKPNKPRQIARSVEIALVAQLLKNGPFKSKKCAVIEYSNSDEAPDCLPIIIVKCVNVTRTDDTPLQMYSKVANVVATLITDSEQSNLPQYEALACEMEFWLEDLATMQVQFNKPTSGRDLRSIRGLKLHYIDEFQTDTDTSGTQWEFGVGLSLILDQVDS